MPSGQRHSAAVIDRVVGMYRAGASLASISEAARIPYPALLKTLARLRDQGRIRPRRMNGERDVRPMTKAVGAPCPVCRGATTPQPVPWGACVTKGARICA